MILDYTILIFCSALFLFFNGAEISSAPAEENPRENTLKLVYVLFRHGNRTPNGPGELYPRDPYREERYHQVGLGQLTNAGKRREFLIGKSLRERYNNFLGSYYVPEIIEPWSTDYNRTKMSLLLVLASLYPPRGDQIWKNSLDWQPIPYNYLPSSEDEVLLGVLCPYYLKLYNHHVQSPQVQARFNKYREIFRYISKNSGRNITKFQDVYNLAFGLRAEEDWGFKLPNWTKPIWPKNITEISIKEYSIATGTTEMRRMACGYFLQKFINDIFSKINGTESERRIFLNSAHEDNIANLLITLGIFEPPHIPNYGAYLIFEVHQIDGIYGIKIYYQNYVTNKPKLMKLPACETFCPLSQFIALTEEYMPTSELCYRE